MAESPRIYRLMKVDIDLNKGCKLVWVLSQQRALMPARN